MAWKGTGNALNTPVISAASEVTDNELFIMRSNLIAK